MIWLPPWPNFISDRLSNVNICYKNLLFICLVVPCVDSSTRAENLFQGSGYQQRRIEERKKERKKAEILSIDK